jgi:hypothetical protein
LYICIAIEQFISLASLAPDSTLLSNDSFRVLPLTARSILNLKKEHFMKQDVMPAIVRMDQETLKKLTAEVRETVAPGYALTKIRFTAVNLWKINRNWKQTSRFASKRVF